MAADTVTGDDSWFEDFAPGQRIRHARAATIDAVSGAFLAKSAMNTAQVHWNDRAERADTLGPGFVVFGMLSASTVLGLAGQDTIENAVGELRYDDFRFMAPVYQGDTLQAYTEVLRTEVRPGEGVGEVEFLHWGVNQHDRPVFRGRRTALVRCRPAPDGGGSDG